MGEFKVRKGFSFIGLVLTLLLMGILAGGMYSLGGRDSGGISVVKTATDTAETTRILAELEALKAGAGLLLLERRGSPVSGLDGALDALQVHVDRRLNPERHTLRARDDRLFVGIRINRETAMRLPPDRNLYWNAFGEAPSEDDLVSEKSPRSAGWAFMRVQ